VGLRRQRPQRPHHVGVHCRQRPTLRVGDHHPTCRLWGRLAYNPDAPAETWRRQLQSEFDSLARPVEAALATTSRILPLITTAHDPAAASNLYWPEMYAHQSIVNPNNNTYSEAPTPKVFGNVTSLDPQLFASVNDYVDSLLANTPLAKVTPFDVARQLDLWSLSPLTEFPRIDKTFPNPKNAEFRRLAADATIAAGLGQFFAHKFRAAILWQLFNLSAHEPARAAAVDAYKKARAAWASLADTAKVYGPNQPYGSAAALQGHWSDRLPALDADIAAMAARAAQPRGTDYQKETIDRLIQSIVNPPQVDIKAAPPPTHTSPASFKPNQPLALELARAQHFDSVRLCYRHLHQGERYVSLDMHKQADRFTTAIPADFTNAPFPLQYYFELRTATTAALFPGFKENFIGTPYFVVLPAQ
jgi:hypothetical protein